MADLQPDGIARIEPRELPPLAGGMTAASVFPVQAGSAQGDPVGKLTGADIQAGVAASSSIAPAIALFLHSSCI